MSQVARQNKQFKRILQALEKSQPALAVARARLFLTECPEHGPGWLLLGEALGRLARYAEAEEALTTAQRFMPPERLDIAYAQLGDLYGERGDLDKAATWYRQAIEVAPQSACAYLQLGNILAKQGRLQEAEEVYRQATECEKGCLGEAYLHLGLMLRAQERYEEAVECFEQALEREPSYREAHDALRDVRKAMKFQRKH